MAVYTRGVEVAGYLVGVEADEMPDLVVYELPGLDKPSNVSIGRAKDIGDVGDGQELRKIVLVPPGPRDRPCSSGACHAHPDPPACLSRGIVGSMWSAAEVVLIRLRSALTW